MEAADFKLYTKIQPDTNTSAKNIHSLNSSVCETWKCYCLDIKCIPAWVVLTVFQKMLSLSTPRTDCLGTVLVSWEKYQVGLCNFSLSSRKCYGWYVFSPIRISVCPVTYREHLGVVVDVSGQCEATYIHPNTARIQQTCRRRACSPTGVSVGPVAGTLVL